MKDKLIEIKKANQNCAQYTGTVTVASYLGDRLIKKETYHNAGLNNLFKFIGNCLQGNWFEAKYTRPCKLVMLKADEKEILTDEELAEALKSSTSAKKSTPSNAETAEYWNSSYAVCNPIIYDTAANAEFSNNGGNPSSSVTYHFRVPFLSLVSGSKIKKLMLLPSISTNYAQDACAYYVLKEPIEVPPAGGNFTVIIDWTLTFTNASNN